MRTVPPAGKPRASHRPAGLAVSDLVSARDEERFWPRIYSGEIVCFARRPEIERLSRCARRHARAAFGTNDALRAHLLFKREEFFRRANGVQEEFRVDPEVRNLAAEILGAIGLDVGGIYLDSVELRIAPPVSTHGGGTRSHLKAHRDLWGVGITQQTNWWMPLWPLSRRRTFAFYPAHWSLPIANDTETWSVRAYREARLRAAPGEAPAYPSAPIAKEEPVCEPVPALPRPGSLLCFSSAHLHASVPNTTNLTRFSLEWRTVRAADVIAGRGAPNVDCRTPAPVYRLFSELTGRTNLAEALGQ